MASEKEHYKERLGREVQPGEVVAVGCAYCYGRGTDPFGVPGPTSKCTACGGTGKLLGRRMTCTTCKGKGVMTVRPGAVTGRRFGTSAGAAAPTALGTITSSTLSTGQQGQVAPVSLGRSAQPASVADQIATHIANFPGVKAAHVEVLFGLSKGDSKKELQELVQARKIRLEEDGLYYPV